MGSGIFSLPTQCANRRGVWGRESFFRRSDATCWKAACVGKKKTPDPIFVRWKKESRPLFAFLFAVAACCLFQAAAAAESPNIVFVELTDRAVDLPGAAMHLPPPTMSEGLSAEQQRRVLMQLADDNRPLEALLRKSIVAPFVLKISDDKTPGANLSGTARRLDAWFVVHGDFARLTSEDFLLDQITPDARPDKEKGDFQGHPLSASELAARSIAPASNERLFHLAFNLFDRVQLSATNRAMLTRSADSAIVAGRIDPRFDADPALPNRWQPLTRDGLGRLQAGAAQPYRAAGWYLKATRLHEPSGAILMEYHVVFDEPHGWFDGANLLRSKLPLLAQDAIRRFRRKAAEMR